MWSIAANLIVDEALDNGFLVYSYDYATQVRVKWFGKEIPRVRGISAVL